VVIFTPRPLYSQGKIPRCRLLDRRLGGSQNLFERGGEEKNSQLLPELEPPIRRTVCFTKYERMKGENTMAEANV
jgi:hypothetical protein